MEIHKEDLMADWHLAVNGQKPFPIDPLRQIMNPRVNSVEANNDYTLLIVFTSGEKKLLDVKPYLDKGIFSELKNLEIFLKVSASLGTVIWPNELDFCPDTIYLESLPI